MNCKVEWNEADLSCWENRSFRVSFAHVSLEFRFSRNLGVRRLDGDREDRRRIKDDSGYQDPRVSNSRVFKEFRLVSNKTPIHRAKRQKLLTLIINLMWNTLTWRIKKTGDRGIKELLLESNRSAFQRRTVFLEPVSWRFFKMAKTLARNY